MIRRSYYALPGNLRNLKLIEEEIALPTPTEVQVEVRAIGLNFADVFGVMGLYEAVGKESFIPGLEYSGVITIVGSAVTSLKVGDKVIGVMRFGAYTTIINSDPRLLIQLQADWSFEEGAGYLVATLTAYYGLIEQCHLRKGETVLIHSAAGGVGLMANRIAKAYQCFTIGLVGTAAKVPFCKAEGYDEIIVRGKDFKRQLQDALGGRVLDVVMECTGGRFHKESLNALAKRGRMTVYGFAHYMPAGNRISYLRVLWKYLTRPRMDIFSFNNISVSSFNLIHLFDITDDMREMLAAIGTLKLGKPIVTERYHFEDMQGALRHLKSGTSTGKIVVTI